MLPIHVHHHQYHHFQGQYPSVQTHSLQFKRMSTITYNTHILVYVQINSKPLSNTGGGGGVRILKNAKLTSSAFNKSSCGLNFTYVLAWLDCPGIQLSPAVCVCSRFLHSASNCLHIWGNPHWANTHIRQVYFNIFCCKIFMTKSEYLWNLKVSGMLLC
jgi:hypothetical protein